MSIKISSMEWQENLLNPNADIYGQVAAQVIGNVSGISDDSDFSPV